jgi:monothiol glutaredoxin
MRKVLNETSLTEHAAKKIGSYHGEIVTQVEEAIKKHEWVVVGMAGNVFVKKARSLLAAKNIAFEYIEHGSYLSKWKERLAIKLSSGWPTFPQVFQDLETYLNK